jgi:hypothetical protein
MRTVNFYRFDNGKCPVEKYIEALSNKQTEKEIKIAEQRKKTYFSRR